MLAANFGFYHGFVERKGGPARPANSVPFDYGTPDGYEFYLNMGSLADADEEYFKHRQIFWNQNIDNPTYDEFWQSRAQWPHMKNVTCRYYTGMKHAPRLQTSLELSGDGLTLTDCEQVLHNGRRVLQVINRLEQRHNVHIVLNADLVR